MDNNKANISVINLLIAISAFGFVSMLVVLLK
jgi:hypothetical protein